MKQDNYLLCIPLHFVIKKQDGNPIPKFVKLLKEHNLNIFILEIRDIKLFKLKEERIVIYDANKINKLVSELEKSDRQYFYAYIKSRFCIYKNVKKEINSALRIAVSLVKDGYDISESDYSLEIAIMIEDDTFLPMNYKKLKDISKATYNSQKILKFIDDIKKTFKIKPKIYDNSHGAHEHSLFDDPIDISNFFNPRYMLKIQEKWDNEKWSEFSKFVTDYKNMCEKELDLQNKWTKTKSTKS